MRNALRLGPRRGTLLGLGLAEYALILALIAIEILVDVWRRTKYYRLADAINSLSCGIVSTGMRVFFRRTDFSSASAISSIV